MAGRSTEDRDPREIVRDIAPLRYRPQCRARAAGRHDMGDDHTVVALSWRLTVRSGCRCHRVSGGSASVGPSCRLLKGRSRWPASGSSRFSLYRPCHSAGAVLPLRIARSTSLLACTPAVLPSSGFSLCHVRPSLVKRPTRSTSCSSRTADRAREAGQRGRHLRGRAACSAGLAWPPSQA